MGANMMMRRALVDRIEPFDERFGAGCSIPGGEETDYIYRAYAAGLMIEFAPDLLVHHHHGRKTIADACNIMRNYSIAGGAVTAKHALRFPLKFASILIHTKNALLEILTGGKKPLHAARRFFLPEFSRVLRDRHKALSACSQGISDALLHGRHDRRRAARPLRVHWIRHRIPVGMARERNMLAPGTFFAAATALVLITNHSFAACDIPILGGNATAPHAFCAEDRAEIPQVPDDSVHNIDNPPCDAGNYPSADIIHGVIIQLAGSAGAAIGEAYGGSVGEVVGTTLGKMAGDTVNRIIRHNTPGGRSNCTVICLHLPADAINITFIGWVAPVAFRQGLDIVDPCYFVPRPFPNDFPGRCGTAHNGAYASMTVPTIKSDPVSGITACSTAKNWSDSIDRYFGLRVVYDRRS